MVESHLKEWETAITEVGRNKLATYGIPQEEIIREFSYEEMVFLLLTGRRPNETERTLLRSVIVSHVSHGITGQSTLAVRMAADTGASFLHALIAGFSTGAGRYHQGGLEATMREMIELQGIPDLSLESAILDALKQGKRLMGFGHRFHKDFDPRAETLVQIADEIGHRGAYFLRMKAIRDIVHREKGVPMNIEAAGGAILLDLGVAPEVAHIIIIIGRAPMFAAAYMERLNEGRPPFQRIKVFDDLGPYK